ncbi:MAG: ABC transporter ATP-binding protein [Eggerthellaceae bacterium]|nr:ABC transporter ATP-binding protein [Eggerthellaceae bacterium]
MLANMLPYVIAWLVVRDLVDVAPYWQHAQHIKTFGWIVFASAVAGILLYFIGLMFTHLAAFRTASTIRKTSLSQLMKAPLGFFNKNASGFLRNRIDGAAAETETLLAHNLADITGTIVMFVAMIALMFVFNWVMGLACLFSAVVSVVAMFSMMGGENASYVAEQQKAQDHVSKAGTEYVRSIPVVKVFQQTVHSFTTFKQAITDYSDHAQYYTVDVCKKPQTVNLVFTNGAFVFLVPAALILAPHALASGNFSIFLIDFAFYAIFSAITSTALARVMFAASGMMLAQGALDRVSSAIDAPELVWPKQGEEKHIEDNSVVFDDVTFSYTKENRPALSHVSLEVLPGKTVAFVGPSGSGKTTAASLIPRFWDCDEGSVRVGGADVREVNERELMNAISFVFQENKLFKTSIFENVRIARPEATEAEVEKALHAAQCDDILEKLPSGMHTAIGTQGVYLSGGEQQRVALARAILKDAPIVVLDEATAFADPENEALIQAALHNLTKNKTVIMIAHRLSTIVGADEIAVFNDGKIAERGTHSELLALGGLYASMWENYNTAAQWKISSEVN